jgi:phenylpropionate dioxygenase-like ring-hydroxylating dioxygenase large terminal subunit
MTLTDRLSEEIESGWTLPAEWYCDEEIFQLEQRQIFERSWQYVGRLESLQKSGDYLTAVIGRVPVVVVRNQRSELAAFVNVCRHRCSEVVQGSGHRNVLQCHYHAWTYDLDGRLVSAPRSDREASFDAEELCLASVQVDAWGPFVFVNASADSAALAEQLGELPRLMSNDGLDFEQLSFRERSEWDVSANWKIVVENFDECYHCPVAHPSFSRMMQVDPDSYALETGERWSRATTGLRTWPPDRTPDLAYDTSGPVTGAQFAFLWPNFTLVQNPGPNNAAALYFVPVSPTQTKVITEYLFDESASPEVIADMVEFNVVVGAEDQRLVESVQRGMSSGRVPQGRLLLDSERLIQHFQRLVHRALTS